MRHQEAPTPETPLGAPGAHCAPRVCLAISASPLIATALADVLAVTLAVTGAGSALTIVFDIRLKVAGAGTEADVPRAETS